MAKEILDVLDIDSITEDLSATMENLTMATSTEVC